MSDRELLQLAAKAAGVVGEYECWAGQGFIEGIRQILNGSKCYRLWNPLTDDGDALRLVSTLGIHLQFATGFSVAYAGSVYAKQFTEHNGDDRHEATRRAIVRAAAEIGAST